MINMARREGLSFDRKDYSADFQRNYLCTKEVHVYGERGQCKYCGKSPSNEDLKIEAERKRILGQIELASQHCGMFFQNTNWVDALYKCASLEEAKHIKEEMGISLSRIARVADPSITIDTHFEVNGAGSVICDFFESPEPDMLVGPTKKDLKELNYRQGLLPKIPQILENIEKLKL